MQSKSYHETNPKSSSALFSCTSANDFLIGDFLLIEDLLTEGFFLFRTGLSLDTGSAELIMEWARIHERRTGSAPFYTTIHNQVSKWNAG